MEHIKQITLWLTSILLIVGLSACDELVSTLSDGDTPHGIPNAIRVGIVMPLSGKYVTAPDDPATL